MKSRAIVLRTVKYSDDAFVADLLTEQCGPVAMMVRISHSKRASVRHTLFQPFAVLDVEWEHRSKANLQRPKAVGVSLPLCSIPFDPFKSTVALFLAEFLHYAVRTDEDARGVFDYVVRSVEWLDTCQGGFANFHLVFLLRLCRFLGFMPNAEHYQAGCCFDLRASVFCAARPAHPDHLPPAEAALLPKLLRMRYATMHLFKFSGAERSRLLGYINIYYRLHLPDFPELKSLEVLRHVFSGT